MHSDIKLPNIVIMAHDDTSDPSQMLVVSLIDLAAVTEEVCRMRMHAYACTHTSLCMGLNPNLYWGHRLLCKPCMQRTAHSSASPTCTFAAYVHCCNAQALSGALQRTTSWCPAAHHHPPTPPLAPSLPAALRAAT